MYDPRAYAVRKDRTISVMVCGYLENSCFSAEIVGWYPSEEAELNPEIANAQVFVNQSFPKPLPLMNIPTLVPWFAHVDIKDDKHQTVAVFINNSPTIEVQVNVEGLEWIVIALQTAEQDKPVGCAAVPHGFPHPHIYKEVYGPDSRENCAKWIGLSCQKVPGFPAE
jgi:uncharacterized Zn-finger protein